MSGTEVEEGSTVGTEAVPTEAIAQAVRAGVRPTLTEWLALAPEVRWRWQLEAERVPLRTAEELLQAVRAAVDELAVRSALDRAHADELDRVRRGAP